MRATPNRAARFFISERRTKSNVTRKMSAVSHMWRRFLR